MIRLELINQRKGISPIIATLLLILIAIAAGVIVYAYVVGFIGGSTTNSGGSTSVIQISNFCASHTTNCGSGNAYSITVLNTGTASISGTVQIYFTDITASTSGSTTCTASSVAPGSTYVCSNTAWTGIISTPSVGDSLSLKIVNPDGGATTSSTKVIG